MNRRNFLQFAGASATAMLGTAAPVRPPNVIVVLSDDQGYGDLSCHGNPVLKTPSLDKLHSQSLRFTDFHAAPMCTPTRGQLLSGQDALRNGATSVTAGRAMLRLGIPTMGDIFRANGYSTGIFGKWHVGDHYPYRPMDRGFDEAIYFHGYGMSSAPEFDNDYFDGGYYHNGTRKKFSGYCNDFWFNSAMQWMDKRRQGTQPFLCYIPTNIPHGPAWVDDSYSGPYKTGKLPAAFFGMIANFDENMGKLDAYLNKSALAENTIVIYMTDNGGTAGVNVYNAGMRGRKTMYYEGGHRVPCFVRWPGGKLRAPGDIAANSQVQDILPTLVDLCGLKKTQGAQFDGTSLAGLMKGTAKSLPDRMLVVQYGQILKKWDSCVVWNQWRLVNGTELYNIKDDPGQKEDVAAKNPEPLKRMRDHYEAWWQRQQSTVSSYCANTVGAPQENPVTLVSSDWQDIYADNPMTVLNADAGERGGPWNILVHADGDYVIELRRWHPSIDVALNEACPVQKKRKGQLPEGKAVPVAKVRLTVAGQDLTVDARPGARSANFRVKLKGGTRTQLQGWFQDAAGKDLCGAYYAIVRRA